MTVVYQNEIMLLRWYISSIICDDATIIVYVSYESNNSKSIAVSAILIVR